MNYTRLIVSVVNLIIIWLLLLAYFRFIPDTFTLVYFVAMLIIPLLTVIGIVVKSKTQKSFHLASVLLKIIMLSGILYMILVNILIKRFT